MDIKLDEDIGADPDIKYFEQFVRIGMLLKYTWGGSLFQCECALDGFCLINFYPPFFVLNGLQVRVILDKI